MRYNPWRKVSGIYIYFIFSFIYGVASFVNIVVEPIRFYFTLSEFWAFIYLFWKWKHFKRIENVDRHFIVCLMLRSFITVTSTFVSQADHYFYCCLILNSPGRIYLILNLIPKTAHDSFRGHKLRSLVDIYIYKRYHDL